MKHTIFRYIAIAATLLAAAVNASAQYNITNGVGTSKKATQIDAETYTIRLETFATGTTTVTETDTPVNVVLVLDVSGSMAWPKGDYSQSTKTSYSYNDIVEGDMEYFRKYSTSSSYIEKIFGEKVVVSGQTRYYLYISPDDGTGNYQGTYLTSNGGTTTGRNDAAYATSPTETIVTPSGTEGGGMWGGGTARTSMFYQGKSRIVALQDAVCAFIDDIEKNDHQDKKGKERDERLHNKISIVKFAGDGNNTSYNDNETIVTLKNTENNVASMKNAVMALMPKGATQTASGLQLANAELAKADADANKVVVLFTDGDPSDSRDTAISSANTSKNEYKAFVYTVGVFTVSPNPGSTTHNYLNYISSNYPNAQSMDNAGTRESTDYYKDASGNVDLTAIFKAIAEGIGGAETPVAASSQVRDIVTNSFILPSTVSAAQVKVYTSAASGDAASGDDTLPPTWGTETPITSVGISIKNVDANGEPIADDDTTTPVANKALFVTGFDYSADDSSEGAGDGNWVGPRYKNGKYTFAGKKLIIEFTVKADPEATGGETLTNTENSGVYVQDKDGNYTCINNYEQPHKTLTVNIKIRKTGLRHGESATFELMRIRPKGWDETKTVAENKENIEYNIIGKPIPGTTETTLPKPTTASDWSDYYKDMGWKSFKKVILTNKGENGAEVVKEVLVLDPYWVYLVLEDDWGWAYTLTGDTQQVGDDGTYTTSSVEVNPFKFHNTENADAVKHAEAIMINHFKSSLSGAKVEHTKSSKVESFTTPTN